MRNVVFWMRFFLLLSVILAGVVALAGLSLASGNNYQQNSIVVGVGLALCAISFIATVVLWMGTRALRRARRVDQKVAGWQIDREIWAAFVRRDSAHAAENSALWRIFKPRDDIPVAGVEVIAARNGFVIDDLFFALEPRGLGAMTGAQWLAGSPECLEFSVLVPTPSTQGTIRTMPGTFRIPVNPAARDAAAMALAYYQLRLTSGELSDTSGHRLLAMVALVAGIVLMPIGGYAIVLAQQGNQTDLVLMTALIGLIGGGGALLIAGIVWVIMLKRT